LSHSSIRSAPPRCAAIAPATESTQISTSMLRQLNESVDQQKLSL
jgi:hypothetical protein